MQLSPQLIVTLLSILSLTPGSAARRSKRGCKASLSATKPIEGINLVAEPISTSSSPAMTGLGAVQTADEPSYSDKVIGPTDLPVSMLSTTTMGDTASGTDVTAVSTRAPSSVAPTSSSSTNASGGNVKKRGKAGVGWPVQEVDAAPVAQFFTPDSTVSWWFDWNKNWNQGIPKSEGVAIDAEFVPMIFAPSYLNNTDTFQEGFTELMGYNEPDHNSSTGVSVYLEPAEAADLWKTQIVQIRQQYPEVKVHSPVMASNKTWLLEFFDLICPDNSASEGWRDCPYKPDYVSTHMYNTDVEYFKGTLTSFQKEFGLPMVLSEFACYQFGSDPHPSLEEVSIFMEQTMEWLDQQDWVVKYAWFGNARNPEYLFDIYETNRLMDTSGALTDLGRQYMNGGKRISA